MERTDYAYCIGTFRPLVARAIRWAILKANTRPSSNNCIVTLRGRGLNDAGKAVKQVRGKWWFRQSTPLRYAKRYAIYIRLKPSLERKQREARMEMHRRAEAYRQNLQRQLEERRVA